METKSLAQAMRERAYWLEKNPGRLEYGWGDVQNVKASLLEMADVIDSWSGEYLSKELTSVENDRRRCGMKGYAYDTPPMTFEERVAAGGSNKRTLDKL